MKPLRTVLVVGLIGLMAMAAMPVTHADGTVTWSGIETDASGTPLAGQYIVLWSDPASPVNGPTYHTVTASGGSFSFTLPPGHYYPFFSSAEACWADGCTGNVYGDTIYDLQPAIDSSGYVPFDIESDLNQNVVLPFQTFTMTVVDPNGAPVVGATVSCPPVQAICEPSASQVELMPGYTEIGGSGLGNGATVTPTTLSTDANGQAVINLLPTTYPNWTGVDQVAGWLATPPDGSGLDPHMEVSPSPFNADNDTALWVLPFSTNLSYAGPGSVNQDAAANLSADLTVPAPAGGAARSATTRRPVAHRYVTITLGKQSCRGVTNSRGVAHCKIKRVHAPKGKHPVKIAFPGDHRYGASAASHTVRVR